MSVYTTVFSASMPIGGLLMGAVASTIGILQAVAIGGVLSLVCGVGALVWYRRIGARDLAAAARARPRRSRAEAVLQSTAPNTNAAFSPPNPNEVLSTRR